MKTNPLTSKLRNFYASISKHRLAVAFIALLLFFLLISLVACKSPATLTNDTQHRTLDSNYHASIQRIETHDTIILGYYPSAQPKLSNCKLSNCPIVRISDRKITIRALHITYQPRQKFKLALSV